MNIDSIIALAARPAPFAPSTLSIWTDPWISRKLLDAHLDDSTDAASRAPAQRERAIAWIESLLGGARGTILDLGCGPGLYAQELALRGHAVTGIDFSPSSLGYAKAAAEAAGLSIDYRQGSYLEADLGFGHDLAMMIYCDFGALPPSSGLLLLGRVHDSLRSGGVFAFDVLGSEAAPSIRPKREWEASAGGGFWSPLPYVALTETFVYPEERCSANQHIVCAEGEEPRVYRTWDRWFDEGEIAGMLAAEGFELAEIRKDLVAKNDFSPSDILFVAARKVG